METTFTIMLFFGAAWWLLKPREGRVRDSRRMRRFYNPYPAASIKPGECPCAAVLSLDEKRYLASEAPEIPLPGCTAATCSCRYVHYGDRRAEGSDRRYVARADESPVPLVERRRGIDRRRLTL